MINAKVESSHNESPASLMRRFTKKVQSSGVIPKAKRGRFNERKMSKFTRKIKALKRNTKRAETEKLVRLGKITERTKR